MPESLFLSDEDAEDDEEEESDDDDDESADDFAGEPEEVLDLLSLR